MYLEAIKTYLTTEFLTLTDIIKNNMLSTHHNTINGFETLEPK